MISADMRIVPLDSFLSQEDVTTKFEVLKFIQQASLNSKELPLSFLSNFVDYLSKTPGLKSEVIFYILDVILTILVSKSNQLHVEHASENNLPSQSILSLVVSTCCCLMKNSNSPKSVRQVRSSVNYCLIFRCFSNAWLVKMRHILVLI